MFTIIGIVVVFGAVVAGYLMEHGNLKVLMQPAELIIIGGAAIGTVLVANPIHILKKIAGGVGGSIRKLKVQKQRYLESLKMMYELFGRARKDGLMALETDSDAPDQSPILSKYPSFLKDHHALAFVCDSIRLASSGGVDPFDADQMIERDMDVHHHGATQPIAALATMADSLPGLGNCRSGAGSGDHDGSARRAAGGNRTQGGCRACGDVSGNFVVLRIGGAGSR